MTILVNLYPLNPATFYLSQISISSSFTFNSIDYGSVTKLKLLNIPKWVEQTSVHKENSTEKYDLTDFKFNFKPSIGVRKI